MPNMNHQLENVEFVAGETTHLSFPIATVMAGMATARPADPCRDLYLDYRMSLDRALTALAAGNEADYERYFNTANTLGRKGFSQLCFWARD
jgi:hypothetical protein